MSILGGLSTAYNIYQNERSRGDQLKQQKYLNEMAEQDRAYNRYVTENSVNIRMQDLKNAGLHPTLAAGGSGATTTAQSMSPGSTSTPSHLSTEEIANLRLQQRAQRAAISQTEADAARIRNSMKNEDTRVAIEAAKAGLDIDRYENIEKTVSYRDQRRLEIQEIKSGFENTAIQSGIDETKARTAAQLMENAYMHKHKQKMPVNRTEFEHMDRIYGHFLQQLGVPRGKVSETIERLGQKLQKLNHQKRKEKRFLSPSENFKKMYEDVEKQQSDTYGKWKRRINFLRRR